MNLTFELPWPPTANSYWRRNGGRYFISKRGKEYRDYVIRHCEGCAGIFTREDRLRVKIKAYPPDKRRRDLDNLFKSLLDALQHSGIYYDDSQIDKLAIERMPETGGKISICVELID